MLKTPSLYRIGVNYQEDDEGLVQKCHLIKCERAPGKFQNTELKRMASLYYLTYNLIVTYNQHLR